MGRSGALATADGAAAASRRRAATSLLLAFAAAAGLAFVIASLAFNITHGQYVRFWGDDDASSEWLGPPLLLLLLKSHCRAATRPRFNRRCASPSCAALPGQQQQQREPRDAATQRILETRVCGSPAVDGYAHVEPPCLEASPTNKWWQEVKPSPDDLDVHIEKNADYDGLAGACSSLWWLVGACVFAGARYLTLKTLLPPLLPAPLPSCRSGLGHWQHKGQRGGVRRGVPPAQAARA